MDADLNRRLDYELKQLSALRNTCARRLMNLNGREYTLLRKTKRKHGGVYYYAGRKGKKKFSYLGNARVSEVKRIREAHFLKEYISRIDDNIAAIKRFIADYLPYDRYSINAALREIYRGDVTPVSEAYRIEGEKWLAEKIAFQKEYPENYPEHKTERASDGTMLKTISELLVYERLKDAGLYVLYELPLVLNDYGPAIYPDFTILSPVDMKTVIIVEFVGRLDMSVYREAFARKLGRYIENGYIPGVNLFLIYGDKDGHVDSMQINRVIADIKGI